jgi:hypothetical protein
MTRGARDVKTPLDRALVLSVYLSGPEAVRRPNSSPARLKKELLSSSCSVKLWGRRHGEWDHCQHLRQQRGAHRRARRHHLPRGKMQSALASLLPSYVSFHNVVLLLDLFHRMFLSRAEGPEYGGVHLAELFLPRLSLNVCLRLDWDRFSFEFPPCCLPDRVLVVAFLAFEHGTRYRCASFCV